MEDYLYKSYFGIIHEIQEDKINKKYLDNIIHGILNNMYFCVFIFNKYKNNDKYNLCHFCISKFTSNEYINFNYIEKYKPVYFNLTTSPCKEKLIKIIEKYNWMKYSLGIFLLDDIETMKKYIPLPEINILDYCIKYSKIEAYNYYIEKAKELGCIYKFYDLVNYKYYNKPIKITVYHKINITKTNTEYKDDFEDINLIKELKNKLECQNTIIHQKININEEDQEYIACRYGDINQVIKIKEFSDIMINSLIECMNENLYFAIQMYKENQNIISKEIIQNIINKENYKVKYLYNDSILSKNIWEIEYPEEIKEYNYHCASIYLGNSNIK